MSPETIQNSIRQNLPIFDSKDLNGRPYKTYQAGDPEI
jgi:hypothetical protein